MLKTEVGLAAVPETTRTTLAPLVAVVWEESPTLLLV